LTCIAREEGEGEKEKKGLQALTGLGKRGGVFSISLSVGGKGGGEKSPVPKDLKRGKRMDFPLLLCREEKGGKREREKSQRFRGKSKGGGKKDWWKLQLLLSISRERKRGEK